MNRSVSFRVAGLSGRHPDSAGRVLPAGWGGRAFVRVLELTLGAVWVSAGVVKARESADFVRDVLDYAVIGFDGAMFVGIVLPWLEIAIGACLVLGVALRIAMLLSGVLLGAFVALQVSAIARGLTIDCGCGLVTGDESAVVGWGTVLRTALLLAVTVILGAWHIHREACAGGSGRNGRPNPAAPSQNPQIALLAVAGSILWGGSTWAQSDRPNDGAYWYSKASERLSEFTNDEFNALSEYLHTGPGAERPKWVADLLDRYSPLLEEVKHGARRKNATLNMGYAVRGTPRNAQMPFLTEMTAFSLLLWADAVHGGDSTGTAESVSAMYTLAAHQVMDSPDASLSAMGRFMNAEAAADRLLDEGRLDPVGAAMIARSLGRFPADDPFRLLEAEVSGRSAYLAKLKDASDAELAAGPPVSPIGARDRRPLSRESVDFALEFLDEAEKIYASGNRKDARERMIELVNWAKSSGQADALADIDRFVQAFDASERMRGLFDRRLTEIRRVMSGGEARNAAGLYRIAIAEFAPRRAAFWAAVELSQRRQEAQPGVQSDALNQALENVRGLLALLAEASEIEECDFSTAGVSTSIDFLPEYATGLHELVRVLEVRARWHLDAEDPAEAIADLLTASRIAGHLSRDANMLSALVAHDAVRRILGELSERFGEHAPDFLVGNDLAKIMARFQPDDPFGYHRSAFCTRDALPARLTGCTAQDFESWSHDDLYALVMYIAVLAHGETALTQPWVVRFETIETLFDANALDSLRATWEKLTVDSFRHWARQRSFTASPFEAPGKPMFGFADAMTSVPDDWKSLLDLVRTPTPPDR